ncbi:MAG: hypothetical protein ABIH64_06155 [Nanoarchaeota archaeon]
MSSLDYQLSEIIEGIENTRRILWATIRQHLSDLYDGKGERGK